MRRQRVRVSIAAMAALGLVGAACGSDDDEASPTTAAGANTTAAGGATSSGAESSTTGKAPTGDPIEVMVIDIISGGIGGNQYPQNVSTAKAAAAAINAEGGIKGRPLVVTSCDTKQDAAQEAVCAETLEKSKAVAVIADGSGRSTAVVDTTVKNKIASVGVKGNGSTNLLGASVSQFPINSPAPSLFVCPPALLAAGAPKIGALAYSLARSDELVAGVKAVIANTPGASFTTQTNLSLDATDYAGPLQTSINNGANGVVPLFGAPGLIATMKANNGRVKVCTADGIVNNSDLIDMGNAAEGFIAMSSVPPINLVGASGTAGKQFIADMAAYEKSAGDALVKPDRQDSQTVNVWMSMRAFQKVANSLPGDVTRQAVFDGFTNLKDLDFPGLLPHPIDFTKTTSVPNLARNFMSDYHAYQWSAKDKAFVQLSKQPFDLIKLLGGS